MLSWNWQFIPKKEKNFSHISNFFSIKVQATSHLRPISSLTGMWLGPKKGSKNSGKHGCSQRKQADGRRKEYCPLSLAKKKKAYGTTLCLFSNSSL